MFSDQHKGAKNGSDDFAANERIILLRSHIISMNGYFYINLGDSEELWENILPPVKKIQFPSFEKEKLFLQRKRVYQNIWQSRSLLGQ